MKHMDSKAENYAEMWEAALREYNAKAERLSAEKRMEYNDAFENFSTEIAAATDWTAATWDEFMAKVDRKWQEFAIDLQD